MKLQLRQAMMIFTAFRWSQTSAPSLMARHEWTLVGHICMKWSWDFYLMGLVENFQRKSDPVDRTEVIRDEEWEGSTGAETQNFNLLVLLPCDQLWSTGAETQVKFQFLGLTSVWSTLINYSGNPCLNSIFLLTFAWSTLINYSGNPCLNSIFFTYFRVINCDKLQRKPMSKLYFFDWIPRDQLW
jgi:hypothetical protein